MKNLDKVVVITGASSGIGEATAHLLNENGMTVVLAARRIDKLNEIIASLPDPSHALAIATDVSKPTEVQNLINQTIEKFGRVDVLFNNAGLMPLAPIRDGKVNEWEAMIDINLKGVLYGINAVLPTMEQQHEGLIITTDSVAGHEVATNGAVYAGTKFAVRAIMDGLRKEEIGKDVRTTLISPGDVETDLFNSTSDSKLRDQIQQIKQTAGLKPMDVAEAVLYAIQQPTSVGINEIIMRSPNQEF